MPEVTGNAATGTVSASQHWQVSNMVMIEPDLIIYFCVVGRCLIVTIVTNFKKIRSKNLATLKCRGKDLGDMFLGVF